MEPELWLQVKRILHECVEISPDRRDAFIAETCGGNPALASEVRSLLASHDQMGAFLEPPPLDELCDPLIGRRIGNYQICAPIAEGGMGTVYRAVRANDFEKQVAIKVVKRGMDTNSILRRFRYERQILAGLDHPNMARVVDGGATEDGRPYLVMDYVQGTPVLDFCRQNHLTIIASLELFRTICSAVQYAHQNLIVHRDLKSSNILVTADGVPKLLDFGIAKLLEPDTEMTVTSLQLMTPECASPEQVRGEPITTATDVYALGVLLYELLTGEKPYDFTTRTAEEIRRTVCETEPKRPSSLRPLSEDLDQIVRKAMHKDSSRRYSSVAELSEDIHRYLVGLPVKARKETLSYRASKFLIRHKRASAAAALVALSIIAGMAATLWEAHVARIERAHAERRFNDVRQLANSLIFEVHDGVRNLPGSTEVRKLIIDRALTYLDSLSNEAGNDNSLRRELASAYLRLGQVQGEHGLSNLGSGQASIASFRKAAQLGEQVIANDPGNVPDLRALASAYDKLGAALWDTGDRKEAEMFQEKALQIRQGISSRLPTVESQKDLAFSFFNMAAHQWSLADMTGAIENFQKSLNLYENVAQAEPNSSVNQRNLSITHKRLGAMLIENEQLSDALTHYQAAQAIDERRIAANPSDAVARMDITFAYTDIAEIVARQGDLARALQNLRRVQKIREELVQLDPKDERARSGLASTYSRLARVLTSMGDFRNAVECIEKALQIQESLVAGDPLSALDQQTLAHMYGDAGFIYIRLAEMPSAPQTTLPLWRKARGYYQRMQEILATLKTRGKLDVAAATDATNAAREISECDAAIVRLTAAGSR